MFIKVGRIYCSSNAAIKKWVKMAVYLHFLPKFFSLAMEGGQQWGFRTEMWWNKTLFPNENEGGEEVELSLVGALSEGSIRCRSIEQDARSSCV